MSTFNKILKTKNQNKNNKENSENIQKQQPSAPLMDITKKNQIKNQIIQDNTSELATYIEYGSTQTQTDTEIQGHSYNKNTFKPQEETEKLKRNTIKENKKINNNIRKYKIR